MSTVTARPSVIFNRDHYLDEKYLKDRRLVVFKITKLLRALPSSSTNTTDLGKAARLLDELLYRSASSFESYRDLSTLDRRIRTIIAVKVQRRMQTRHLKSNRRTALKKHLGGQKYFETAELVREIRLVKNQKVSTMKCTNKTSCCRGIGNASSSSSFPPVIRNLFFETALVNAFEKTPVERIPILDWEGLITTAKSNLKAYHESS